MPDADTTPFDDAACQRALALLIDVGSAIALELKTPDPKTLAARAAAFDRVAQAIRRTILLARDIAAKPTRIAPAAQTTRDQARKKIVRTVEDVIEQVATPADAPALRLELVERVESPDFARDLAHRSPAELIDELCRDLGIKRDFQGHPIGRRRTPADIALLNAQTAAAAKSDLTTWTAELLHPRQ